MRQKERKLKPSILAAYAIAFYGAWTACEFWLSPFIISAIRSE